MFGRNEISRSFRIESKIGSGGSGAVYKAWHKRMQKYIVVKEQIYRSKNDAETRRNELEALKNIKSVYIPQVFDYITTGTRSYTVMEYIEGESFDKRLGRGKKSTQTQVIKWYGQLASALVSLHSRDVCHRDIKPANIMLTAGGDACLIDFNSAFIKGNKTQFTSRSLGYASPEQYELYERLKTSRDEPVRLKSHRRGFFPFYYAETQMIEGGGRTTQIENGSLSAGTSTVKTGVRTPLLNVLPAMNDIDWKLSDIYSLGATMYHILTGRRPPKKPAEAPAEIVGILDSGDYCGGLVDLIRKSVQIQPSDRFASAVILANAIQDVGLANCCY